MVKESMDLEPFLQRLQALDLDAGKRFLQEHSAELGEPAIFGPRLREASLKLLHAQPALALKLADLLIFYGQHTGHTASYAMGMTARGGVLANQGYNQAALKCLDEGGDVFQTLDDELNWARSRIVWIVSCAWLGDIEQALQVATRARETFMSLDEYYWACAIDINTAIICKYAGRYQQALKLYDRVLATYPLLKEFDESYLQRSIAIAEHNKATNLALIGAFEESSSLLRKSQQSFQDLGDIISVVSSEMNIAKNAFVQGYYGSALRHYYDARNIYIQHEIDNPQILARMLLQMSMCFLKLNRVSDAHNIGAQAVEVTEKLESRMERIDSLHGYATILIASGALQEALEPLGEAETISQGYDYLTVMTQLRRSETYNKQQIYGKAYKLAAQISAYYNAQGLIALLMQAQLAMVEAAIGLVQAGQAEAYQINLAQTQELCRQLVKSATHTNLQDIVYRSLHLLGRMALLQSDGQHANRFFLSAIGRIEHLLSDLVYDLSPTFLRTAWDVYEDMIGLQLQDGHYELAFHYLERARSIALRQYLQAAQGRSMLAQPGASEEDDARELDDVRRAKGASLLQREYELSLWQKKYHEYSALLATRDEDLVASINREEVEATVKQCEAKIAELFEWLHLLRSDGAQTPSITGYRKRVRTSSGLDVQQLQRALQPDQTLLTYYIFQGTLVIFVITAQSFSVCKQPGVIPQLEQYLLLLHAHLQPGGWSDALYPPQQIIRGLLKKLHRLLIAPVAEHLADTTKLLTIVPYGVLHQLPFHALYDGSRFLIEDFQINYLPASSLLLDLQNMRQLNEHEIYTALVMGCSGHSNLPSALEEARSIAELLHGACKLEEEATIEHLQTGTQGCPLIHLATHGHSRLDAPNFSSIVLTDGYLNAIDAFSLNLQGCELVTLSGCETGLALSGGGDEQLGLGRAFLAAGARSLVMSIWPVEDASTSFLMQTFYQHLLRGESKVEALRLAQQTMLKHAGARYSHPYFWAAFRLVGDVQPFSQQVIKKLRGEINT
ncbi:hypothetical protein KSC_053970 [Ktedonobacter sp. SOSP1-52]|uniref:CHAT domain-containing protein n=1 Tax=Ktedonobacter sp. SOSP1-52 TaxID=2778366 RepID=UPI0019151802|nr:CHAT domain-containing protein [Ktedonobacter sp. SOSP1-52]GHO66505.1 hypothetical protein KSC_053970 [Ktedonobacter sp. SOSP1-52]